VSDAGSRPTAAGGGHPQVSFEDEPLVVVDEQDRVLGYRPKAECHRGDGILHRAFSAFLFDRAGRLLLQRRAAAKPLWPLHWSNSVCSHPRRGEKEADAVRRRVEEEVGVRTDLELLYRFQYHARYGEAGSERELCSVWVGAADGPIRPNENEIAEWRWVEPAVLDQEIAARPNAFTPWIKIEWARLRGEFRDRLASFRRA